MEKKGLYLFFSILMIKLVNAAQLSDLLDSIDQSTVVLYATFIISFSLLFFSLGRLFKENKTPAGIVAAMLAFLLTYWVNKTGLDIEGFFYDIGISEEVLSFILPIVIIAGMIYVIMNFAKNSLFIFGGLFILASFFVYEKTILIGIGIILIIARMFIPNKVWNSKEKNFINKGFGI